MTAEMRSSAQLPRAQGCTTPSPTKAIKSDAMVIFFFNAKIHFVKFLVKIVNPTNYIDKLNV